MDDSGVAYSTVWCRGYAPAARDGLAPLPSGTCSNPRRPYHASKHQPVLACEGATMGALLMLCLFGFLGLYLFFWVLGLVFKLVFGILGAVFGLFGGLFALAAAGTAFLVTGILGLCLLPLAGLLLLPFALPVLFVAGLVWLLMRGQHRGRRFAL